MLWWNTSYCPLHLFLFQYVAHLHSFLFSSFLLFSSYLFIFRMVSVCIFSNETLSGGHIFQPRDYEHVKHTVDQCERSLASNPEGKVTLLFHLHFFVSQHLNHNAFPHV